jgi:hypothetical protein
VDRKLCEKKHSRPIWNNMWIRSGDRGRCYDLIWGDIWIGTDDRGICHDQIGSGMFIWKDVTGSIHDNFEVLFDLKMMIEDDIMT